jgi:hypothetical protein
MPARADGPARAAEGFAIRTRNPWTSRGWGRCGNVADGDRGAAGVRRLFSGVIK